MKGKGWQVSFEVSGLGIEKVLNSAQKQGIILEALERKENRQLRLCCGVRDYPRFLLLAKEKGFIVSAPKPLGCYALIVRLWHRKGLLSGLFLCAFALAFSTQFIWQVRVVNAGAYEAEVRSFLQEIGVHPGIRRSAVAPQTIGEKLEWRFPRVKWVQCAFSGMGLTIRLEEGIPPPEIAGIEQAADVIAREDGILLRLTAYAGTPVCKAGDLVKKGQVLIRGEERRGQEETVPVRARGEAIARVWVSREAKASLLETCSKATGRESSGVFIVTPFFVWPLQAEPSFLTWDEDRHETALGGVWLPITVRRTTYIEEALEQKPRSLEAAQAEAARSALLALQKAEILEDFIDKWVDYSMIEGDIIVAKATAEIARDIAGYQN